MLCSRRERQWLLQYCSSCRGVGSTHTHTQITRQMSHIPMVYRAFVHCKLTCSWPSPHVVCIDYPISGEWMMTTTIQHVAVNQLLTIHFINIFKAKSITLLDLFLALAPPPVFAPSSLLAITIMMSTCVCLKSFALCLIEI